MKRDRRNDLYPIRLCEGIYAGSLLKDIALKSAIKSYKSQLLQRLQTNNDTHSKTSIVICQEHSQIDRPYLLLKHEQPSPMILN